MDFTVLDQGIPEPSCLEDDLMLYWIKHNKKLNIRGELTSHVKIGYEDYYVDSDELAGIEKVVDLEVYE